MPQGYGRGRRPTDKGVIVRKTTRKMWAAAAGVTGIALSPRPARPARVIATTTTRPTAATSPSRSRRSTSSATPTSLFEEYEAANPGITIEHKKAATSNEARDNLNTRLAAGSGLSDIEAIEVDWLPSLLQYPDKFVDLELPDVEGRWLDWKAAQATTADGKASSATAPTSAPRPSRTAPTCSVPRACPRTGAGVTGNESF